MEDEMAKKATIQVDPEFQIGEDELSFFNICVQWAQQLNNLVGGISVCFSRENKYPSWSPFARASFLWRGKFLAEMTWRLDFDRIQGYIFDSSGSGAVRSPFVDEKTVWKEVFQEGILRIIRAENEVSQSLQNKLAGIVWSDASAAAD